MLITFEMMDWLLSRSYQTINRARWDQNDGIQDVQLLSTADCQPEVLYLNIENPSRIDGHHQVITVLSPEEMATADIRYGYFLLWPDGKKVDAVNTILRLFHECCHWMQHVHILAYIQHDIGALLKTGSEYFECDCTIINAQYNIEMIAYAKRGKIGQADHIEEHEFDMYMEDVLSDPGFDRTFNHRKLEYFENKWYPEQNCYYYNLWNGNEYIGRILISRMPPLYPKHQGLLVFLLKKCPIVISST